ncbi:unnamed protein product [Gongylonema pulchrum]|uniref:Transposase n=1 Tax=Gongylonema pulchrum TaxID=637853 RepID=A0A183DN96_9BILA|nr:unnamed protein product [Gongylonema pulchrum]
MRRQVKYENSLNLQRREVSIADARATACHEASPTYWSWEEISDELTPDLVTELSPRSSVLTTMP